ncbi:hypothetical protein C8R43DRAFT_942541 [Mycena crocata]|nr:hypothetical protein C8R43DRAFT_942541 [Mycena crocata]
MLRRSHKFQPREMDVQQKYYTDHASELPDRPNDFSASSWSSMKLGHHAQRIVGCEIQQHKLVLPVGTLLGETRIQTVFAGHDGGFRLMQVRPPGLLWRAVPQRIVGCEIQQHKLVLPIGTLLGETRIQPVFAGHDGGFQLMQVRTPRFLWRAVLQKIVGCEIQQHKLVLPVGTLLGETRIQTVFAGHDGPAPGFLWRAVLQRIVGCEIQQHKLVLPIGTLLGETRIQTVFAGHDGGFRLMQVRPPRFLWRAVLQRIVGCEIQQHKLVLPIGTLLGETRIQTVFAGHDGGFRLMQVRPPRFLWRAVLQRIVGCEIQQHKLVLPVGTLLGETRIQTVFAGHDGPAPGFLWRAVLQRIVGCEIQQHKLVLPIGTLLGETRIQTVFAGHDGGFRLMQVRPPRFLWRAVLQRIVGCEIQQHKLVLPIGTLLGETRIQTVFAGHDGGFRLMQVRPPRFLWRAVLQRIVGCEIQQHKLVLPVGTLLGETRIQPVFAGHDGGFQLMQVRPPRFLWRAVLQKIVGCEIQQHKLLSEQHEIGSPRSARPYDFSASYRSSMKLGHHAQGCLKYSHAESQVSASPNGCSAEILHRCCNHASELPARPNDFSASSWSSMKLGHHAQKYYTDHASELPDRPNDFSASSWSSMKLGHHAQKYYTDHASELPDRPNDFSASSWSSMKLGHHAQRIVGCEIQQHKLVVPIGTLLGETRIPTVFAGHDGGFRLMQVRPPGFLWRAVLQRIVGCEIQQHKLVLPIGTLLGETRIQPVFAGHDGGFQLMQVRTPRFLWRAVLQKIVGCEIQQHKLVLPVGTLLGETRIQTVFAGHDGGFRLMQVRPPGFLWRAVLQRIVGCEIQQHKLVVPIGTLLGETRIPTVFAGHDGGFRLMQVRPPGFLWRAVPQRIVGCEIQQHKLVLPIGTLLGETRIQPVFAGHDGGFQLMQVRTPRFLWRAVLQKIVGCEIQQHKLVLPVGTLLGETRIQTVFAGHDGPAPGFLWRAVLQRIVGCEIQQHKLVLPIGTLLGETRIQTVFAGHDGGFRLMQVRPPRFLWRAVLQRIVGCEIQQHKLVLPIGTLLGETRIQTVFAGHDGGFRLMQVRPPRFLWRAVLQRIVGCEIQQHKLVLPVGTLLGETRIQPVFAGHDGGFQLMQVRPPRFLWRAVLQKIVGCEIQQHKLVLPVETLLGQNSIRTASPRITSPTL